MGPLRKLVAGLKLLVVDEFRDWTILLVGLAVFAGAAIGGAELFGDVIGLGLGLVCGLAAAAVVADRFPDPLEQHRQ